MIYCADFERYQPYGRCERWMFLAPDGTWGNITTVDGRGLYRFSIIGSPDRIAPDKLDVGALLRRAIGDDTIERSVACRRCRRMATEPMRGECVPQQACRFGGRCRTYDLTYRRPRSQHQLGDCSDLGWMLPALLQGWGGAGLLSAYTAERRAAIRASSQSTRNYKVWVENEGREHILEDSDAGQRQRQALGARMRALLKQEWQSLRSPWATTIRIHRSSSPTAHRPLPTSRAHMSKQPAPVIVRRTLGWLRAGRRLIYSVTDSCCWHSDQDPAT